MKKSILLILFLSVLLVSCEDSKVTNGRSLYKKYLNENLKDPESLKIYSESYENSPGHVVFKVDVGAKNSYGGYVRKDYVFEVIGDLLIVNGEPQFKNK